MKREERDWMQGESSMFAIMYSMNLWTVHLFEGPSFSIRSQMLLRPVNTLLIG